MCETVPIRGDKKLECRTVNREPDENLASGQPPSKLVDPYIVKGHPGGTLARRELTGFGGVPETRGLDLFVTLYGIPRPPVAGGEAQGTDGTTENGTGWRRPSVLISTVEEDDWTQQEQCGRKGICQPEADILREW